MRLVSLVARQRLLPASRTCWSKAAKRRSRSDALHWSRHKAGRGKGHLGRADRTRCTRQRRGSPGCLRCLCCKAQRCPLGAAHPAAHPRLEGLSFGDSLSRLFSPSSRSHAPGLLWETGLKDVRHKSVGSVCAASAARVRVPALGPSPDRTQGQDLPGKASALGWIDSWSWNCN